MSRGKRLFCAGITVMLFVKRYTFNAKELEKKIHAMPNGKRLFCEGITVMLFVKRYTFNTKELEKKIHAMPNGERLFCAGIPVMLFVRFLTCLIQSAILERLCEMSFSFKLLFCDIFSEKSSKNSYFVI